MLRTFSWEKTFCGGQFPDANYNMQSIVLKDLHGLGSSGMLRRSRCLSCPWWAEPVRLLILEQGDDDDDDDDGMVVVVAVVSNFDSEVFEPS